MNYGFSTEVPKLEIASAQLIIDNAATLIMYIYNNKKKYTDPEIRVGLTIKILLKVESCFDIDLLKPVINDIEYLLTNETYLNLFSNPALIKECLYKELLLINKYMELSETISLNTRNN